MPTYYSLIGLMSGSSLDGLDLVYGRFWQEESGWMGELVTGQTVDFPKPLHDCLARIRQASALELVETEQLFLKFCVETIEAFIEANQINPLAIVSHGHTVFHNPAKGYTWQIGNGGLLSGMLGRTVVCDFRTLDVGYGRQGAPLVPGAELHLFRQWFACLNLGGIANISFPGHKGKAGIDVVACNQVLNLAASWLGYPFDRDGHLAAKGTLIPSLLEELNNLAYMHIDGLKSLGNEDVARWWFPLVEKFKSQPYDVLLTLCQHIAEAVAATIPIHSERGRILLTGGGALNSFLVQTLQKELGENWEVVVPDRKMVDFKEAYCFAFLGLLRMLNLPNNYAQDLSLGTIYGQQWMHLPQ